MPDDLLEHRVRRALAVGARSAPTTSMQLADVLDHAGCRRRKHTRSGSRYRWVGLAAAVVVAALAGGVMLARDGGTAFASWVSRPESLTAEQLRVVVADCVAATSTNTAAGSAGQVLISERRGHNAYVVLAAASARIDCITPIPGMTADRGLTHTYVAVTAAASSTADAPIIVLSAKATEGNHVLTHPIVWVSGNVDAAVRRVSITTSSGTVEASVVNGRFAAWWPGNDSTTSTVRAYDHAGVLVATVDQLACVHRNAMTPRLRLPHQPPIGGCR